MSEKPAIRWGIITTGMISQWFVGDLMIDRPDAPVKHIIQAIGTSSIDKAKEFAATYCPKQSPALYGSYEEVYNDADVDVVYIGTPHGFHKKNCLDAIAAGRNVFCEKAFTINKKEAEEVFEAAKQKGVYVQEAMWLRHRPLVQEIRKVIFEEKAIGEVFRTYSNFGLAMHIPSLPETSRYKDLRLGAGTLLDIGLYSLTWVLLTLDPGLPKTPETPNIHAFQTHQEGIEVISSVILQFPSTGRHGIVTSTTMSTGDKERLARIDGTEGFIIVHGSAPSFPEAFTVYPKPTREPGGAVTQPEGKLYDFPKIGRGFIYEADNCALDILAGKKESDIMPPSETIRVMGIMDEIRRQGGTKYPVDNE